MLNKWDEKKIQMAIIALENSPCEKTELAKWIYTVAFSTSIGLEGTPCDVLDTIFEPQLDEEASEENGAHTEEVKKASVNAIDMLVPCLYKSEEISDKAKALIKGKARTPRVEDLAVGDLLFTDDTSYVFDGESLVELRANGVLKNDASKVLESLKNTKRFAVLRPAQTIKINPSTERSTEGYTEKQMAVVVAAESYMLRGMRMQYDDTRFLSGGEFRWKIHGKAPEEYTLQDWGYSNCAAFCIDVYKYVLGFETSAISVSGLIKEEAIRPYYYQPTFSESEEERARIKDEFLECLEPGDIILIRRTNGTGHAMLYIGCGDIIHSSGSNYKYEEAKETYEPTIRYMRAEDIFSPEVYPSSYVFEKISELAIVRPIMNEALTVSDEAGLRVENMQGIVAEKLSSHNRAISINEGESITYTVSVYNTGKSDKTLDVVCKIPENTTLLTDDISGEISIAGGEKKLLSYTLRVDGGKTVSGKGVTVGGLEVNAPDVYVKNTLLQKDMRLIEKALDTFAFEGDAIENANGIYKTALGREIFEEKEYIELRRGLLKIDGAGRFIPRKSAGLAKMSVPDMWGGRMLYTETFATGRVSLMKSEYLITGDIVFVKTGGEESLYIWANEILIDLENGEKLNDAKAFLEGLISSEEYFILLRPSMMW